MKPLWLKAKDNNVPIGSGKISRRILVYKRKKTRKTFTPPKVTSMFKSNKSFTGGKSDKAKSRLQFPSSACKIIFMHWQRLGFPFMKHREDKSKTTSRAIMLINASSKAEGGKEPIIRAMDTCKELFNSDWFKYRVFFDQNKMSLPSFFFFLDGSYQKILRKCPSCPRSWFKECKNRNIKNLKKKYSVSIKDNNPNLTNQLIIIWGNYTKENLTTNDRRKLAVLSFKINKIATRNSKNEYLTENIHMGDIKQFIITIFEQMLIEYKTYQPKHIGWLLTDTFLNEEIPKEIIRQNLFTTEQLNWKRE